MADTGATAVEAHDEPALTPREHLDVIHDHVHHAMDAMDSAHAEPDADEHGGPSDHDADEPHGMARIRALSATRRAGFPADSGAARSHAAILRVGR